MSYLLNADPFTGVDTIATYDRETDSLIIKREQWTAPIWELNKASYNDTDQRWRGESNEMWHVASVPLIVLEGWAREWAEHTGKVFVDPFGNDPDFNRFIKGRLNSSDWRGLRTAPVRV